MRRGHHNNLRDSLPVFSHPYLVPVPVGGLEPPSHPYEGCARNHLRYTGIDVVFWAPIHPLWEAYQVVTDTTNPNNVIAESRGPDPHPHCCERSVFEAVPARLSGWLSIGKALGSPTRISSGLGGADFYKFLTFIHTNIGYDHSPVPGCGLISLMVFMLKLRGELRTRTPYPKVQSVFKAVPARLSG